MTSFIITPPLLFTPALKNNIYPVCHHHTVDVCLPAFVSGSNDDYHSPLLSGILLERGVDTLCLCEIGLSQEKWEQRAEYRQKTQSSLVSHNISIRHNLNAKACPFCVCMFMCVCED